MTDLMPGRSWCVETIDVLEGLRAMPAGSVHCVCTSPPYFALRDYQVSGQIGLEKTPDAYVAKIVEVFGEVRRVMRDDATLWMNIGDSYAQATVRHREGVGDGGVRGPEWVDNHRSTAVGGLKPKDLIGMPWVLAFALRADGWYLRSEIIWHKRSPMPESVRDRPTKAHEQIFLLTKKERYYYDAVASAETARTGRGERFRAEAYTNNHSFNNHDKKPGAKGGGCPGDGGTRNMRSVWTLSTEPFAQAHFATFPTELVRRCLLAGTSEKGCCPTCGAPWKRVLEKTRRPTRPGESSKVYKTPDGWDTSAGAHSSIHREGREKGFTGYVHKEHRDDDEIGNRDPERHVTEIVTKGWKASCECGGEPQPCLVLDPFSGAGTTGVVARRMGLRYYGIELNPEYAQMSRRRILDDQPLLNAM